MGTAAMMAAHIDIRRNDPEKKAYIGGHALHILFMLSYDVPFA